MTEKNLGGDGGMSRLVLMGGFLGAGKTTIIYHYLKWLSDSGLKVGVVTNDQGVGLVDSETLSGGGVRHGAPGRVDPAYQWTAHGLRGGDDISYLLEGLEYRHCRGINTSWKHDRTDRWTLDPNTHVFDEPLNRAFAPIDWPSSDDVSGCEGH